MDRYIPKETPYAYNGAEEQWDEEELRKAFANAQVIRGRSQDIPREVVFPQLATYVGNSAVLMIPAGSPTPMLSSFHPGFPFAGDKDHQQRYKLTKVGVLNRKGVPGVIPRPESLLNL